MSDLFSGQRREAATRRAPRLVAPPAPEPVQWTAADDADRLDRGADHAATLAAAIRAVAGEALDVGRVRSIVSEALDGERTATAAAIEAALDAALANVLAPSRLEVSYRGAPPVLIEAHHKALPTVLQWLASGDNVLLVGPAGSGKTTLAEQAAKAMALPFAFNGAIASEYKLSGFIDAQGRTVQTAFRRVFEHGGVYLFDEIDASAPAAVLAFNSALSNGYFDFPDGPVARHANAYFIASANTWGHGADRQYIGRTQQDGAALDRFARVAIDYDEDLERALCPDPDWCSYVQQVRAACRRLSIRQVVSPRASIAGARALAAGVPRADVEAARLFAGLSADDVAKIRAEV